tara:strand:+ start:224 stop:349 length:126 start_codon:yes stop_codon:yes gene_type:complete
MGGPYGQDVDFALWLVGAALLFLLAAAVGEALHNHLTRKRN